MANTIPCPNPTCSYDFSSAELQTANSLQCPKCGFRMQGRGSGGAAPAAKPISSAKPATPPAKPATGARALPPAKQATPGKPALPPAKPAQASPKPAAAPPLATPPPPVKSASPTAKAAAVPQAKPIPSVSPLAPTNTPSWLEEPEPVAASTPASPPLAAPVPSPGTPEQSAETIDGAFFNPDVATETGTLVQAVKGKKQPFNWHRLLLYVFAIGFAASIVIVAMTAIFYFFLGSGGVLSNKTAEGTVYNGIIRNQKDSNEKIYQLILPKSDWSVDNEVQSKFGAHAAWKHNEYDLWFALVVKDYVTAKPRDAEMLRLAIDKLEAYYGDSVELDTKAVSAKVGEEAAQKLRFKGQILAANWLGECYMFFHNGIAYWLYVASPQWETVEYFAAELPEKHFKIVSERRGWREQAPPIETFTSLNGKVTMSAQKELWEKHNAKNEDENGELLLQGRYIKDKKDNRKSAHMLMFTIEKKDDLKDAIKAARVYLENKIKADDNSFKFVQASDGDKKQSEFGTIEDIGNRRGRIIDLKLQFNDEPKRYYLLAVINEPDMAYAISCECTWESRQIWRQEFLDLLGSVKIKKGE